MVDARPSDQPKPIPMTDDGFSERRFSASDGLILSARIYASGNRDALPVVCLPGLTRNARDFHRLALHLSRNAPQPRDVVVFDYRGRGRSDYDPDWRNYTVGTETGDVIAGLTALGIEHACFIGTSRGGLIIHALAAARAAALKAVVLNDVGPVVEGAGLAQIRAMLERSPKPASFVEATRILEAANRNAFPSLDADDWERWTRAVYRDEGGRPVADFDPKLVKTLTSINLSQPLPVLWPQFHGLKSIPMLAIRGEHSSLLSQATLDAMAKVHPRMESITVAGQGHAPLLETGTLPARIADFVARATRKD
jgi:pimeloyl-ACP methyl ester carboxylesterase